MKMMFNSFFFIPEMIFESTAKGSYEQKKL